MEPNGNQHMHTTTLGIAQPSFLCVQSDASDTHTNYEAINTPLLYDTPVNFLNDMTLRIETYQQKLVKHPYEASCSPDVLHTLNVQYNATNNYLQFECVLTPSNIQIGQILSFTVYSITTTMNSVDVNERLLADWLFMSRNKHMVVTDVDTQNRTVSVNAKPLQPPETLIDTQLTLDHLHSVLLNESMQYSLVFQFVCSEKRLQCQRVI